MAHFQIPKDLFHEEGYQQVNGDTNWLKLSSLPSGKAEEAVAALAGPLFGLLSAMFGLVMSRCSIKATFKQAWLAYTLAISLVAALYYLRAPMRTGGDEHDVAINWGIAQSLVVIQLALGYLVCLLLGLRTLPTWKVRWIWLGTILLGAITTGLPMAMLDPLIIAQVDAGNPFFQPIIGYSLPVIMTILLALSGVFTWVRRQPFATSGQEN